LILAKLLDNLQKVNSWFEVILMFNCQEVFLLTIQNLGSQAL
ncbi:12427_t:CDS:1, partial [Dentiscutata heterogama]